MTGPFLMSSSVFSFIYLFVIKTVHEVQIKGRKTFLVSSLVFFVLFCAAD